MYDILNPPNLTAKQANCGTLTFYLSHYSFQLEVDDLGDGSIFYWNKSNNEVMDLIIKYTGETPVHNTAKQACSWLVKAIKDCVKQERGFLENLENIQTEKA